MGFTDSEISRMHRMAYLLPDPGTEVVHGLIAELQAARALLSDVLILVPDQYELRDKIRACLGFAGDDDTGVQEPLPLETRENDDPKLQSRDNAIRILTCIVPSSRQSSIDAAFACIVHQAKKELGYLNANRTEANEWPPTGQQWHQLGNSSKNALIHTVWDHLAPDGKARCVKTWRLVASSVQAQVIKENW